MYKGTKLACYLSNASMSAVAILSPLLFVTFHAAFDISYTALGFLVLINFATQLSVDLLFSFFSQKFHIPMTVRAMPALTVLGMAVYAVGPLLFPGAAYAFLLAGTVIFSASAGLGEVLISPVIAALPSEHPDRDMSLAHSIYAWGVAAVVVISTVYLYFFPEAWPFLVLLWALLPASAFLVFLRSDIPPLSLSEPVAQGKDQRPLSRLFLPFCILCIFLGGATENTMTQWVSDYAETALGLPKLWGDMCGTAIFAVMLGLGRTLYAKYGKNITPILRIGFAASAVCYLAAAVSSSPLLGLAACALTGLCVSMLWPGTLIFTTDHVPNASVAVYALLAAGGDLGGSVAPQLLGIITDAVKEAGLSSFFGGAYSSDAVGMKVGMLTAAAFPLFGLAVVAVLVRLTRKNRP